MRHVLKSIDIVYNQTVSIPKEEVKEEEAEQNLVGVWDGTLECSSCCSPKYRYTLTITKHELASELIEGSIKNFRNSRSAILCCF